MQFPPPAETGPPTESVQCESGRPASQAMLRWMLFQAGGPGQTDRSSPLLADWGDLDERERELHIRPGQPFLLRADGTADKDVLSYFKSPSCRRLKPETRLSYAYDLKAHLSFLSSQGVDWRDATEEHLEDYEYWRRHDEDNPRRVGPAKYARELYACRHFYELQARRGVISRSPVEVVTVRRYGGRVTTTPRLQPPNARRTRMKWLTPAAYREWCDVGLGGSTHDGRPWLGRNDQRNLAFAETMWSSGLRLREGGTLLLQELPAAGLYPQARIAEDVAKGSDRDFWISVEALQAIDDYRVSSRAKAVRRAQAAGRYDNVPGIMIASSVTASRQLIYENEHGNEQMVSLDSLSAEQRRKVFVEGNDGLEPAMVWLSEGGMPLPYRTWQKVFQVANARCAAEGMEYRCYPHMLRHSFALRWLVVFMHAHEVRFGLDASEREELRRTHGDPYVMVQQLLGHSSVETTRSIYLQPAQRVPLELFLREGGAKFVTPDALLSVVVSASDRVQDVPR